MCLEEREFSGWWIIKRFYFSFKIHLISLLGSSLDYVVCFNFSAGTEPSWTLNHLMLGGCGNVLYYQTPLMVRHMMKDGPTTGLSPIRLLHVFYASERTQTIVSFAGCHQLFLFPNQLGGSTYVLIDLLYEIMIKWILSKHCHIQLKQGHPSFIL